MEKSEVEEKKDQLEAQQDPNNAQNDVLLSLNSS
jgi:hypothetical protein